MDGKELDTEDAKHLDEEWNKQRSDLQNEDLLPKKPVKINDTWKIDTEILIKDLEKSGLVGDPKNSKATGKLLKTYTKGTQLFGVIEAEIEIGVKSLNEMGMELPAKDGSKFGLHLEIDTAIDGSMSEVSAKSKTTGEITLDVPGVEITIKVEAEGKETSKPVKK